MVRDWRNKASSLDGENRGLNRQVSALQEAVDKYGEIEKENVKLGRKIVELNREIATLSLVEEQGRPMLDQGCMHDYTSCVKICLKTPINET